MKKLLSLLLAIMLCVLCFAGCGGGVDKSKQKPQADKDDTVITVWSGDGGGKAVWDELVDEWNAGEGDKKNIFINWEVIMDATQLDVAFQSDQLPEIIGVGSTTQSDIIREAGKLVPLADLPGGKEFLEEFGQAAVEGVTMFDGKVYGIQRKAVTAALAYNKDLFKQAGIVDKNGEAKPPKTIAELREAAKKINALGEGIYGFAFPLNFSLGYTVESLTKPSFNLDNPEEEINLDTLTVTYPGKKERYQWILDMKKDGTVMPGAETLNNDNARAYFSSGVVGMIPAVSWDVGVYTTQFPAECDWDVCDFPTLDGRERWVNYTNRQGSMTISSSALKNDKTKAATMEVYKFIYSVETRATLFEKGIDISSKTDVLDVVDKSKIDPRFLKFAELVDEDYVAYPSEKFTTEGDDWKTTFQKVWMGEISLDAAIQDYAKRRTEGLRTSVKKGEYDVATQKATEAQKRADFVALKAKRAAK